MKRRTLAGLIACLALALTAAPQAPQTAPSLARLMPPGALLYLQAQNFQSLLGDWNGSAEKAQWLKSDDFRVFARSRLFLKLQDAQKEFATAAGFRADMPFLESVAGGQSALGLYDVGRLEFLYVTHLTSARALESVLGKARERFQSRQVGGATYYLREDTAHHRVVAFAVSGGYLLVATRENLLAGALQRLAGESAPALVGEDWFAAAARAAGAPGELRLALNLQALARSPHFRSYWIQRNVSELRQYESEISDLNRSADEIREDRVLVRLNAPQGAVPVPGGTALGEILRFVPTGAGLYRAWETPGSERALDLIAGKVLEPRLGAAPTSQMAPSVDLGEGVTGSSRELETRIDQAPLAAPSGALQPQALKELLAASPPTAVLEVESTRPAAGGVFVGTQSAVVVSAARDWDGAAARAALRSAVESLWTVSDLGTHWVERRSGARTYFELDGLNHLAMAAEGRFLFVATNPQVLEAALAGLAHPAAEVRGVYAAGFRHARERQQLVHLLRLVETPYGARGLTYRNPAGHTPLFFSENLASLSGALARVESETIVVEDRGDRVTQTVRYRLKP